MDVTGTHAMRSDGAKDDANERRGAPVPSHKALLHEVRRDRLRWLAQLRWWAMVGALLGAIIAVAADWSFVSAPAIAGGVALGVLVNGVLLWRTRRADTFGAHELSLHVVADLFALSWLLAWAGGLRNPLSLLFSFHVVLGALLAGRRGTLVATAGALLATAALFTLEHTGLLPTPPLERAPEALWLLSLGLLIGGLSYFALVLAGRLREERAHAFRNQEEAEHNLRLLLDALDALKVGLELFDPSSEVRVRNSYARLLRALPVLGDRAALPSKGAGFREGEGASVFRFAVEEKSGDKRIIDKLTLSPSPEVPLGAFLYVDRTEELLVEQRHVLLERLATLGRALQGVAHELNTPLMTMQTLAKDLHAALRELPLDAAARADLEESLDIIIEESRRCKGLTQGLLSTAHDGSQGGRSGTQTALQVARRAVQLVGPSAKKGEVALDEAALDRALPVDADRVMQVLMNLVQNALKATEDIRGEGPRVSLTAHEVPGALVLDIEDRGPGLPPEVRARLFEPFVTTRPAGEGTGLGLYVSHMIAQELGGELLLEDREGGGTRARLLLPEESAGETAHEVRHAV